MKLYFFAALVTKSSLNILRRRISNNGGGASSDKGAKAVSELSGAVEARKNPGVTMLSESSPVAVGTLPYVGRRGTPHTGWSDMPAGESGHQILFRHAAMNRLMFPGSVCR